MLYINVGAHKAGWYVGMAFPLQYHECNQPDISLQADGDELDLILSLCKNIRQTSLRVQRWFDEDAKFICAALLSFSLPSK